MIDTTKANMSRVYDYWLGGKDNFAADRQVAEAMTAAFPPMPLLARANRDFVITAACRAADDGKIGQFIDLGAGLPTAPAVHEAVRVSVPDARVAYVDNDPVVLSHARALLAGPGIAAVGADLREPGTVLASPALREVIDFAKPVGVILAAVLHFLDSDQARDVVTAYVQAVPPGSWVLVSVAHIADGRLLAELTDLYKAGTFVNHDLEDVAWWLDGLQVAEPGITDARRWIARVAEPPANGAFMLCAAAVKQ